MNNKKLFNLFLIGLLVLMGVYYVVATSAVTNLISISNTGVTGWVGGYYLLNVSEHGIKNVSVSSVYWYYLNTTSGAYENLTYNRTSDPAQNHSSLIKTNNASFTNWDGQTITINVTASTNDTDWTFNSTNSTTYTITVDNTAPVISNICIQYNYSYITVDAPNSGWDNTNTKANSSTEIVDWTCNADYLNGTRFFPNATFKINATVTDASAGVEEVTLYYKNNGTANNLTLEAKENGYGSTHRYTLKAMPAHTLSNLYYTNTTVGDITNGTFMFVIYANDSSQLDTAYRYDYNIRNERVANNSALASRAVGGYNITIDQCIPEINLTPITHAADLFQRNANYSHTDTFYINITVNETGGGVNRRAGACNHESNITAYYRLRNADNSSTSAWYLMENWTAGSTQCTPTLGYNGEDREVCNFTKQLKLADSNNWTIDVMANDSANNKQIVLGIMTNITIDYIDPNYQSFSCDKTVVYTSDATGVTCTSIGSNEGGGADGNLRYTVTLTKSDGNIVEKQGESVTFSGSDINQAGTYSITATVLEEGSSKRSTAYADTLSLRVLYPSGSSGGGSSGGSGSGGAATVTFDVDFTEISEGTLSIAEGSTRTFSFDGATEHTLEVTEITEDSATITVTSVPITRTLRVGGSEEFDINEDGINDLKVTLNAITEGIADLTVAKLEEGAKIVAEEEIATAEAAAAAAEEAEGKASSKNLVITLIVIVLVIAIGYVVLRKKK